MHVVMIGISHQTAPIAVRERFALAGDVSPLLDAMRDKVPEAVVLATCNRTELYSVAEDPYSGIQALTHCAETIYPADFPQWHDRFYRHSGYGAVRHIMRVACGLESMVIGEAEILGQVRQAMETSLLHFPDAKILPKLFQEAVNLGRKARIHTAIGQNAASVSSVAVELAERVLGDFHNRRALLIGTGSMGQSIAQLLRSKGILSLTVATRDPDKAVANLPSSYRFIPPEQISTCLPEVDLVVAATTSKQPILNVDTLEPTIPLRRGRPLVVIDVGVPRNVSAEIRNVPGVFAFDLDQLQKVADDNLFKRRAEIEKVEFMIEAHATRFMKWLGSRDVLPTIVALRHKAEAIRQTELQRLGPEIRNLSEAERRLVERLTERIVSKLLHDPTVRLKELADENQRMAYARALAELFDLTSGSDAIRGHGS